MENIALIRKIAWSYHKTTGVEYKELFSEASLGYCEALRLYDPTKNIKLNTYAWRTMTHQLNHFLWQNGKDPLRVNKITSYPNSKGSSMYDELEQLSFNSPDSLVSLQPEAFSDFYKELPILCKELVNIIFDTYEEMPEGLSAKQMRGFIIKVLLEKGWAHKKIWDSIRLMKKKFK